MELDEFLNALFLEVSFQLLGRSLFVVHLPNEDGDEAFLYLLKHELNRIYG